MSDHPYESVALIVTLDSLTLCRAAGLGGLPIALDDAPIDACDGSLELVKLFAKRGIINAISESFDRLYPPRYPDDVIDELWPNQGVATSQFGTIWRGKVTW